MTTRRHHLAERRRFLGYNQEALAEHVGADRSTISRWECGVCEPQAVMRPRLAAVLQVTLPELDALLVLSDEDQDPSHPPATPVITGLVAPPTGPDLDECDDMNRRELLRLLSVAGALATLPQPTDADGTGLADTGTELDQHEQLNVHLWQVFALSQSKRLVYPLVNQQLHVLTVALDQARNSAARQRLCSLAGDLFQLSGEIFFDTNRYGEAAHCYTLAAEASKQAGAHDLWACAITRHAFISLSERRFPEAASMLSAAARVASRGDSQLSTRQWVAAVQAQAYAGMGDLGACTRALDSADRVAALSGPVTSSGWLRFDGSRLAEERGTCYRELGRADLAEGALNEALNQTMSLRRRGSVLIDLALLGLQCDDLDQVLHYGQAALALAEQTQSAGYIGRKLHNLHQQLGPHPTDRRVTQFRDRIPQLRISPDH
ncbi:transcriptional regulator [Nonomuraea typhae]|uniref:Transcriptional regulator n=1 Tax=Nonomuraea typhae TaxID=2603600 RepID=A0ABW7YQ81_9ACTN